MAATIWPANAVAGSPSYSGRSLRQVLGALLGGKTLARPLGARSFISVDPSLSVTTTTWTVGPFCGLLDGEASAIAGAYNFAFDANSTGSVNAPHATLPRLDLLYVQIDDPAESDGTSTPAVRVAYLAGTAASTPALPATPARSMALASISVPASGGGSPTITLIAPYGAAAGGVIRCRNSSEYPASPLVGTLVSDDSLNGQLMRWTGTLWAPPVSDTGWQNITSFGGNYAAGGVIPQYRVKAGILYLRGQVNRTSGTAVAGESVCSTPAGARPGQDRLWICSGSTTSAARLQQISGVISVSALTVGAPSLFILDDTPPVPID